MNSILAKLTLVVVFSLVCCRSVSAVSQRAEKPVVHFSLTTRAPTFAVEGPLISGGDKFLPYYKELGATVANRWHDLLRETLVFAGRTNTDNKYQVTLEVRLQEDGRIQRMKVIENTAGKLRCLLCQKAVVDRAPYEKWPGKMRKEIGAADQVLRFKFLFD